MERWGDLKFTLSSLKLGCYSTSSESCRGLKLGRFRIGESPSHRSKLAISMKDFQLRAFSRSSL